MNDQKQQELLRRIEGAGLEEGDVKLIRAVFESYAYVTELIDDKNTSINRLRKLLFGREPRRRPTWSAEISQPKRPRPHLRRVCLKNLRNAQKAMAVMEPPGIRAPTGSKFSMSRSSREIPVRLVNGEPSMP